MILLGKNIRFADYIAEIDTYFSLPNKQMHRVYCHLKYHQQFEKN